MGAVDPEHGLPMRILAFKPGHDGAVALVHDGRLCFSLEAEKDSNPRHSDVAVALVVEAMELADGVPDVIALSGWKRRVGGRNVGIAAGYLGLGVPPVREGRVFGHPVTFFSSSHERSHLLMAAAMAPRAPIQQCAIIVLADGAVVAWVQGRCEIGPRALGHRSLLASPLVASRRDVLNAIKGRESYRPIAPCCLLEDLDRYFAPAIEDPYMLHFSQVIRAPGRRHLPARYAAVRQSAGFAGDHAARELALRARRRLAAGCPLRGR